MYEKIWKEKQFILNGVQVKKSKKLKYINMGGE